ESEGGVLKLIRRRGLPLVITAGIIIVAVVVVRGRVTRNQRAGGPTQNQAAAQQSPPTRPAAISNDTTHSAPLPDRLASKTGDSNLSARQAGNIRPPIIQSTIPTTVRAMGTDTQWNLPSGSN